MGTETTSLTFPPDVKGRPTIEVLRCEAVNRARQDMKVLTGLEDSIKEVGLLHAITLDDTPLPNGNYRILAGERRWRSHLNLLASGHKNFARIAFCFASQLTDLARKKIEYDENIQRENFSMVEQAEITAEIDELQRKIHGEGGAGMGDAGWTNKKTAELRGVSTATVSLQKKLADHLKRDPSLRKLIIDKGMPLQPALKFIEQKKEVERTNAAVASGAITLSSDLLLGDCTTLIADVPSESVACIVTDPPFGNSEIQLAEGSARGTGGGQSYLGGLESADNLSPAQVAELFMKLSPHLWRVLKPGGHFYIFYTQDLRHVIVNCLRTAGLKVIAPDLIWDKGRNMNAFSGYNYMSTYEPVIFGYRPGDKDFMKRLNEPMKNILTCPPIASDDKVHAFQKPKDLLQTFIRQSSLAGDTVLDPFAGSASTLVAARELGRSALGFELSEKNFIAAQKLLGGVS